MELYRTDHAMVGRRHLNTDVTAIYGTSCYVEWSAYGWYIQSGYCLSGASHPKGRRTCRSKNTSNNLGLSYIDGYGG